MRGSARAYLWVTWSSGVGVVGIVVAGAAQGHVQWTLLVVDVSLCVASWSMYRRYRRLSREEESSTTSPPTGGDA